MDTSRPSDSSSTHSLSGNLGGRAEAPGLARSLRKTRPALRFSERKLLLACGDLLVLNAALLLAVVVRSRLPLVASWWGRPSWYVVLCAVWLPIGLLLDIYDLARAASALRSLWASVSTALLTAALYSLIPLITPGLPERRLDLLWFPLVATAGVAAWRVAYATILIQPTFHQTALVIGAGWAGRTLVRAIASTGTEDDNPYRGTGYQVLGFIDDDPAKQGCEIEGVRVIGTHHDLVRLVRLLHPDELIVAVTDPGCIHADLFRAILACWEMGIPVTTMANLYEQVTGRVPVEHAGRNLHVVLPVSRPAGHRLYIAVRRLCEVALALLGCASLLWLVPLVWMANLLTCPGDVFYRQKRVGKGGKTFQILKFRSMVMDAEKHCGAVWARQGDDRITPVGRFLRQTRLDEVPQLWNVLVGEMSLIGPRPERPEFVDQLAQKIPFYRVRHAVKPGVTGWAQVKYRYGSSVKDALVKLQYDLYYIKRQGPYLDLLILLKTVQVVLGMKGT